MDLTLGDTQLIIEKAKAEYVSLKQLAYILATAYWETAKTVRPVEEAFYLQTKYKWSDERMDQWRKSNLRYYPWHGRGFVQLTWADNYIKAEEKLGVPLTASPELAMEADVASSVIVSGMIEGWFTGKKLSDYINDSKCDYVSARRIINGMDKASTIAKVAEEYEVALAKSGYTPGPDSNSLISSIISVVKLVAGAFAKQKD